MAITALDFDPPDVGGDDGTWGAELNQILALFKDAVNQLGTLVNAMGASGFVFYDPTNGWPSNTPDDVPFIFMSPANPTAPAPTHGSDNSLWFYGIAA